MKKLVTIFLFLVFSIKNIYSADYPKIFLDVEYGERYEETEDEYTNYDYDIERGYNYRILKFGYRQSLNKTDYLSLIVKNNEKNYIFSSDKKFDNYANSINGYYKKKINKLLELKLENNYLVRRFDEQISDDKENYWNNTGLSFKITPQSATNFFTEKANIYNLTFTYKKQNYFYASEKNTYANGVAAEWERKISDAFRIETRGRYYIHRYKTETAQRQNSDKYSIAVRFEYDFNK